MHFPNRAAHWAVAFPNRAAHCAYAFPESPQARIARLPFVAFATAQLERLKFLSLGLAFAINILVLFRCELVWCDLRLVDLI